MARLELSDMIVGLRKELLEAQAKAKKENLKFKVESIDLEAKVTISTEATAEGSVKWKFWIFGEAEGKAGGTVGKETVQTIRLKLIPEQDGGAVKVAREPVKIGRKQVKRTG
jgi:hypothetical protein